MKPDDYIPSEHDNPSLVSVKMVDLLRKFNGRGVFAEKNINEGETIGTYTGTVYSSETAYEAYLKESDSDNSYAMKIKKILLMPNLKGILHDLLIIPTCRIMWRFLKRGSVKIMW
ncbi:hypothetical protein LDG_5388 [Legionella drancourtii LLAP12]|uniref:SET domain-containing protein n=2 Tax=Legionella drancourtii TaxID=168933 RepID=G9EJM2_9GAMM|nr:hypothetical protein LDG_5388 [Legionella drancourtii LLAP12]